MLEFMKKRVYRTSFLIYTGALLLACVLVFMLFFNHIFSTQEASCAQTAQQSFASTEQEISTYSDKIDNYILGLYHEQSEGTLRDFMRFLGHNADEYMTARLQALPASSFSSVDFLKSIQQFVQDSRYSISRVSFTLDNKASIANVLTYDTNGTGRLEFAVTNSEKQESGNDDFLFIHNVMNPKDVSKNLGTVRFRVRASELFGDLEKLELGSAAVITDENIIFLHEPYPDEKAALLAASKQSGMQGNLSKGNGLSGHFLRYVSPHSGLKMVYFLPSDEVLRQCSAQLLFLALCMVALFFCITLLIALRMSRDARYLNKITSAIDGMKAGSFTHINLEKRRDEFRIIAQEFNEMSDRLENYVQREYVLKLKQQEAQMKMLQQQINPHFLYNTLDIIRSRALVNEDVEVADAVCGLGSMFRMVVKGQDCISVAEELEILTQYLKIMEFKYKDHFFYQVDVDKEILQMKTIKFWMQPVVENYFVHGIDPSSEFNLLLVNGHLEGNEAVFEFIDNGSGMELKHLEVLNRSLTVVEGEQPAHAGKSIGLQNVYTRLRFFYGEGVFMQLHNNEEAGVTTTIRVPYLPAEGEKETDVQTACSRR